MGNFLVVIPAEGFESEAERLFRKGLHIAETLKHQLPGQTICRQRAWAASFPRQNRSGAPVVCEPRMGSWLLASGTWFHRDNLHSGQERHLLTRYLEVGAEQLASQLEGFFVIVIGDTRTQEVIVVTDLVGSCHAYTRNCHGRLALSGSSLVLAGLDDCQLDPLACQEFLATGTMYEDRTFYAPIRKLAPASIYRFSRGELRSQQRYWSAAGLSPESLESDSAVAHLWKALLRAAHKVGDAFAKPVCDLTGGYDSRALVAGFLGAGLRFSTTVSGADNSPDVKVSRALAKLVGLPHLHVARSHAGTAEFREALALTDGEYELVEYSAVLGVHRYLSKHFDISINGSFGEIARGYWWELLFPAAGARRKLDVHKVARSRFVPSATPSLLSPELKWDPVPHFAGIIERVNAGLERFPNTFQLDHAYLMMRMQRWQGRIASSTNQLWPCFSPFLFRSLLEIMLQTKARLRQRSLLVRRMLAQYQPRLAAFPLEHGYPAVPFTARTFYRFTPVVGYYTRAIGSRFLTKTGLRKPAGAPPGSQSWSEEQVRALLDPSTMVIRDMLDPAVRGQLERGSFPDALSSDKRWLRLLTLEYTLRSLRT
jgi:hypothetical protein